MPPKRKRKIPPELLVGIPPELMAGIPPELLMPSFGSTSTGSDLANTNSQQPTLQPTNNASSVAAGAPSGAIPPGQQPQQGMHQQVQLAPPAQPQLMRQQFNLLYTTPSLGLSLGHETNSQKVKISKVIPGAPHRDTLMAGDVLVGINGRPLPRYENGRDGFDAAIGLLKATPRPMVVAFERWAATNDTPAAWKCDFGCGAFFPTYELAEAHELVCVMNGQTATAPLQSSSAGAYNAMLPYGSMAHDSPNHSCGSTFAHNTAVGSSISLASVFTAPPALLCSFLQRRGNTALKSNEPSPDSASLLQQMQQPDEQIVKAVAEYESGGECASNEATVLGMMSSDDTEEADLTTTSWQVSQVLIGDLIRAAITPMALLTGGLMDTAGIMGMLKPLPFVPGDDAQTDPPLELQRIRERLSDDALCSVFAAYDGMETGGGVNCPVDAWLVSDFIQLGHNIEDLSSLSDAILYSVTPLASFKNKREGEEALGSWGHSGDGTFADLRPGGSAIRWRTYFVCKCRNALSPALPDNYANDDARIEAAKKDADHLVSRRIDCTIHEHSTGRLLDKVAGTDNLQSVLGGNSSEYDADKIRSFGGEGMPGRKIGDGDNDYAFTIKLFTHGIHAFDALDVPADGPTRLNELKEQSLAFGREGRSRTLSNGSVRVRTLVDGVPSETEYDDYTSLRKARGKIGYLQEATVRDAPGGVLILPDRNASVEYI